MYWLRKGRSIFILILIIVIQSFQIKEVIASNSISSLISPTKAENKTESSYKVFILKQIDYNLWKFVPPILYLVGTVGNVLTIAVLRR